jgi:hypothetical protein
MGLSSPFLTKGLLLSRGRQAQRQRKKEKGKRKKARPVFETWMNA